jgi:hypothetical protein
MVFSTRSMDLMGKVLLRVTFSLTRPFDRRGCSRFAVVVVGLWFQLLLDTGGIDNNGGLALNRTLVLADAAPGALLFFDARAFLLVSHDGLIGALLVTDQADFIRIPGDAPGLIDVSHSHLNQPFLLERNRLNRLSGTDPSAEITKFLAVSDPGNKPWRIKTGQTRFQEGRLERIIGTNLQTLSTPCARGNESLFR